MRVLLSEKEFRELVSGKVVSVPGAQIALQDIGYARMIEIITDKLEDLHKKYV